MIQKLLVFALMCCGIAAASIAQDMTHFVNFDELITPAKPNKEFYRHARISSLTSQEYEANSESAQAAFHKECGNVNRSIGVLTRLLTIGVPVDVLNSDGESALASALYRQDEDMIEFLLQKKADPFQQINTPNQQILPVRQYAKKYCNAKIVALIEQHILGLLSRSSQDATPSIDASAPPFEDDFIDLAHTDDISQAPQTEVKRKKDTFMGRMVTFVKDYKKSFIVSALALVGISLYAYKRKSHKPNDKVNKNLD